MSVLSDAVVKLNLTGVKRVTLKYSPEKGATPICFTKAFMKNKKPFPNILKL